MAGKARAQAKAEERAARLAELKKQQRAQERRRNLMVGAVAVVVLALIGAVFYFVSRNNDVDATEAGQSDYGLTIGDADAPHSVIIYEDFLCPFCGELEAETGDRLQELADDGQVYVDYRPFTLLSNVGDYSERATAAFGVVREKSGDEVAKKFHDLLYADQPEESASSFPDADALVATAVEAGADEDAVREGIEAGGNDYSDGATQEAEDAGVSSTPTIIVDGETFTGDPEDLLAAVEK